MGVLSCIPRHLKTIEIYTFRRHEKSQKNSNCYEKNVITKRKELAQWTKQLFYNFTRITVSKQSSTVREFIMIFYQM